MLSRIDPRNPIQTSRSAQLDIAKLQKEIHEQHRVVDEIASAPPERVAQDISNLREQIEQLEAELPDLKSAADVHMQARTFAESEIRGRTEDQDRLRTVLAEAKSVREKTEQLKNENRVVFNASGTRSKRSWLVEISDRQIVARPLGHKDDSVHFASAWRSAAAQFTEWLSEHGPATSHFVLLVRPSGVAAFHELEERLKTRSFAYGFDLIGEAQVVEISSPEPGGTQ